MTMNCLKLLITTAEYSLLFIQVWSWLSTSAGYEMWTVKKLSSKSLMTDYWNSSFNTSFSMHNCLSCFLYYSSTTIFDNSSIPQQRLHCHLCPWICFRAVSHPLCTDSSQLNLLHPTASITYPDVFLTHHLNCRRRNRKIKVLFVCYVTQDFFFSSLFLDCELWGQRKIFNFLVIKIICIVIT